MTRRRFVVLCLLLCLALPFAAFAEGKGESGGAAAKPVEISYEIRIKSGEETTWFQEEIFKQFGVRIKPIGIDANDTEKVNAMLATGDLPDIIVQGNWDQMYKDGLTRTIPQEMVKKYMPNLTKRLNDSYPTGWLTFRAPGKTDQYLAVTGISDSTFLNLWYISFRADWAAKVGLPVPNFDAKKMSVDRWGRTWYVEQDYTIDQFEQLLIAFRDKDPDGNGKNDTIPLGALKYFQYSWNPFLGAFGVGQNQNLMDNGKLVDWRIATGYKNFLKLIQKWYKAGLVDKEFPTLDFGPGWAKVENQIVAATCTSSTYVDMDYALNRPPNSHATLDQVKAGAKVVMIPPLTGPDGKHGANIYSNFPIGIYAWAVNKKVDDAKLAKWMQILDWMRLGTAEEWVHGLYGKENVHFKWQGEAWKSAAVPVEYKDVPAGYPKQGDFGSVYPAYQMGDRSIFLYPTGVRTFIDYLLTGGRKYELVPYRVDLFNETNLAAVNRKVGTALGTMADEYMFKALTAQIDVDATWDDYVANYLKNGGQEVLNELAKAPLYAELRKGVIKY